MSVLRPWPYAAKAVIQWEYSNTTLRIWIIFRHPMDQTVKPPIALWVTTAAGVGNPPDGSNWQDEHTFVIWHTGIAVNPGRVLLAYDGPHEDLRTTWGKQWEDWFKILGIEVPYDWRDIIDVDVVNARVTINGMLLLSHSSITTGTYNALDVKGLNILYLNCGAGDVIINGFINGVLNQLLFIARTESSANDATMSHNNAAGNQKLWLHAMGDETLNGKFGGWNLVCTGIAWYDISHAKHV